MILGFTGTRKGLTAEQLAVFNETLAVFNETVGRAIAPLEAFHHGSCVGADVEAAMAVAAIFPTTRIIAHPGRVDDLWNGVSYVDHVTLPAKPPLARNRDIVEACDLLLACPYWMFERQRGGTWYTVRFARRMGKRVSIIWPDGTVG